MKNILRNKSLSLFVFALSVQLIIPAQAQLNSQYSEMIQKSWGLSNQGQTQVFDLNPMQTFRLQARIGEDIHLLSPQLGRKVRVAVIDTGLDMNHPLFAGRIAGPIFDFVDNDGSPQEEPGGNGYGHGTFVAGLIALTAPQATIMPLRAFDKDGIATSFTIAKAIRHAADNGAQVINLSFGLLEQDTFIKDVLSYAYSRTYMVAAAGNDNQNTIHFPATHKSKTLGVTSVTDGDLKAAFSNYNADVQVAAPGVNLYSAYPGNRWAWWSGTSFSTALVSGEAALILSLRPSLNRSAVNSIITSCGKSINSLNPAYNGKLGKVRIDYLTAVNQTLNRK